MDDRTTLLFALSDFLVLDVTLEPDGGRRVLVESVADQGGCPGCGVLSGVIKDRPTSRVKDLPHGLVPLRVFVRKRRFACVEALCGRRSFTETTVELPARARVTTRLKGKLEAAVTGSNRAVSDLPARTSPAVRRGHRTLRNPRSSRLRRRGGLLGLVALRPSLSSSPRLVQALSRP